MLTKLLEKGDQVAVLSDFGEIFGKVLRISQVESIQSLLTRLVDGSEFFTFNGESVDTKSHVELATDKHRAELKAHSS